MQPPRDLGVPFLYLLIRSRGGEMDWSKAPKSMGAFACLVEVVSMF
jgi:hypothetical protein